MKYVKDTPRITVKFVDADTEETILEYKDRTWMNVGDLFSDFHVNQLMETDLPKNKIRPENLLILAVAEYSQE